MRVCAALCAVGIAAAWSMLPSPSTWPQIIDAFPSEDDIEPYVKVYVAPFWELQHAERNPDVEIDTLRHCLKSAANIALNVTSSFEITDDVFDQHDPALFQAVLDDSLRIFEYAENKDILGLRPVFSPRTLRRFLFQRMDDFLIVAENADQAQQRVEDFKQYVSFYSTRIDTMDEDDVRHLVTRSLDLVEVSRYASRRIRERYDTPLTLDEVRQLRYELHALGNSTLRTSLSLLCALSGVLASIIAFI